MFAVEVFEENNDASGVKYNKNISTRNNSVHPDWFIIPWIPKIPWIIPWIPKIPWIPWLPMPGGGTPPGGGYGGPGEPSAPGGGYGGPGEPSAPGGGYGEPPKEPSAPGGGYGGPGEPSGSINPGQPGDPGEPVEPGPVGPGEPPGKPGGLSEHGGSMTARMPRVETDRTPGGGSGVAGGGSPNQKDYHGGHI